jgi:hypothetical protein
MKEGAAGGRELRRRILACPLFSLGPGSVLENAEARYD